MQGGSTMFLNRERISRALLLTLLLAACGSRSDREGEAVEGAEGSAAELAAANPAAETPEQQAARIRGRIESALAPILLHPKTARYANARNGTGGAVCGDVDSKQADGSFTGPRPFVITPQNIAVVSTAPTVALDDPADEFADFYIRWCASPDELRSLGPRIAAAPIDVRNMQAAEAERPLPAEAQVAPAEPAKPAPAPYSRYPVGQPSPAPATPAPKAKEGDSFFDAVLRGGEKQEVAKQP